MRYFSVKLCTPTGFLLGCICNSANAAVEVGLDIGLRTDYLRWSIPGAFTGRDSIIYRPNIISELTWKNLKTTYLTHHAIYVDGQFVMRGDIGYGRINSGDNQDSDYRGTNRTQEFSRSNNKSNGDYVSDVKFGFGLKLDFGAEPKLQLTPMLGLSAHVQSLRMTNGNQTVSDPQYAPIKLDPSPLGPIPGLSSTYITRWKGPWLGVDTRYQFNDRLSLRANYEYHIADYSAHANWNLRDDLAHPKSFEHSASGYGNVLNITAEVLLSKQMQAYFSITSQEWETGKGSDRFNYADGSSAYGILNNVKWQSQSYLLGLQVRL